MEKYKTIWWIDDTVKYILDEYEVKPSQFMSPSRKENVADARKVISYYLKLSLGLSHTDIGKLLGRVPSTIYLNMKALERLVDVDPKISRLVKYAKAHADIPKGHKYKDVIKVLKASKEKNLKRFIQAILLLKEADKQVVSEKYF